MTGDELLVALSALANGHRLRVVAVLHDKGPTWVSRLARELDLSRPLLHLHLKKLEAAGLVSSSMTLSEDGKALRVVQVTDFAVHLTPDAVATAARTLTHPDTDTGNRRRSTE